MYNENQKVWERENRRLLVKCHLCRDCGKQDANTLGGHSYCFECNEKRNEWGRIYRARNKERINAKRREQYASRKSQNMCGLCGRPMPINDPHSTCPRCRGLEYKRFISKYERKRVGNVCYQCCNAPPMEGKKLCQECYDKNLVKLAKAWAVNQEKKEQRHDRD